MNSNNNNNKNNNTNNHNYNNQTTLMGCDTIEINLVLISALLQMSTKNI